MNDDERDELIGELRGLALTAESHHCHLALHAAADHIDHLEAGLALLETRFDRRGRALMGLMEVTETQLAHIEKAWTGPS